VGRRGRAERDVGRGKVGPGFFQRDRLAAEPLGNGARPLVGTIGDERDLHALIAETRRRELGHVAGAENQGTAPGEIAEDLPRYLDRGGRGGGRSHAQPRLRANARAHVQRGLKQPVEHRAGLGARNLPRLSDLSLDLRFTEDHGIESGRHAIQVADGIAVAGDIPVFAGSISGFRRQPLAKQRPDGVERGLVIGDQIKLGAIARGEQHASARSRRQDLGERRRHLVRAVGEALAHIERRGAVIDPDHLDSQARMTRHRKRSAPGCVSFSAT